MTTWERPTIWKRTIRVGTLPYGRGRSTLYLSADLHPMSGGSRMTTEHQPVTDPAIELSIMGDELYGGHFRSGGQNVETLRRLARSGDLTDADAARWLRLAEVWDRWHLNGMRALCAHQSGLWMDAKLCPVTGYKAGSAWLFEPLPEQVITELKELLQ